MNITNALQNLPLDRLREIARHRLSSVRAVPRISDRRSFIAFLADALSDRHSIQRALSETDLLQLRLLTFLIVEGGAATLERLTEWAGPDSAERIESAVEGLETLGLAFWVNGGKAVFVPNAVRQNTPLPAPLRHPLAQALDRYPIATLLHIRKGLGIPNAEPSSKGALIQSIVPELTDVEYLRANVEDLPTDAQRLLGYLARSGGVAGLAELGQQLDSRQRNQLFTYDWASRWAQGPPRNSVEELLGRGMLVMDGQVGWGYGRLVVPGDVLSLLTGRSLLGSIPRTPEWDTVPAEQSAVRKHDTLVRDVAYLLAFVGKNEATRTAKGLIHRTTIKALAKGLSIRTVEYAGFVYALSREAGLIAPQGRAGLYDITGAGYAWLEMSAEEQVKSLYDVWRVQTVWVETAEEPLADDRAYYHADDARTHRHCAVTLLADLARARGGEFASLGSFVATAQYRWWTRFAREMVHDESSKGILEISRTLSPNEDSPAAQEDDTGSLLTILFQSLVWLGLAEHLVDGRGAPSHYRLTEQGWSILLDETNPNRSSAAEVETFIVQPNLEIYAPPNLAPKLLYRLYRVTEPAANGLLSLTRDSLRRAMDGGEDAKELLTFLKRHSQSGVPQNVEYLIQEVGGRHGHIRVGQAGIYLQVDDPLLLKELKAQKKLDIHFRGQLADTVALVTGDSVEAILRQLRQAGYYPTSDAEQARQHEAAKPSARRRYVPPREPKVSSQDLDTRIQWAAIAEDMGSQWEDAAEEAASESATTAEEVIELLQEAVDRGVCLEIVYQAQNNGPVTERIIEPMALHGSLVEAFCRARQEMRHFNVRYIRRARLTEEPFDG